MEVEPWMKIQLKTPDKTRIYSMAALLRKDVDLILGKLVRWWCWLDLHCTDGHSRMLPESVDSLLRCKGFTDAMRSVGWAELADNGTVDVVHWDEHNGQGAKKRAQDARRQSNYRNSKAAKESQTCHAASVTEHGQVRDLEKEKEYNKKGVGKATLHSEPAQHTPAPLPPAPTRENQGGQPVGNSDRFGEWLAALCQAHPSARRSRTLAVDVDAAARNAFERCPEAVAQAPLLAAYLADNLRQTRYGENFYRPTGQRKFFDDLEDVIAWAEKWDKETGWSRKQQKAAKKAAQASQEAPPSQPKHESGQGCNHAESLAIFDDLKRELEQEEVPLEVKLYPEAVAFVRTEGCARYSVLQGKFRINFAIADKLIKRMQQEGIITNDRERKVVEK